MKNTRWTILAALLLAATSVAQAQENPEGGAPAAPAAGTVDSGAISNAQTTQTTTTTTSSAGIGPDGAAMEGETMMGETTELANTGGEPVLMSLLGLSMALGALAMRKRVSA